MYIFNRGFYLRVDWSGCVCLCNFFFDCILKNNWECVNWFVNVFRKIEKSCFDLNLEWNIYCILRLIDLGYRCEVGIGSVLCKVKKSISWF